MIMWLLGHSKGEGAGGGCASSGTECVRKFVRIQ